MAKKRKIKKSRVFILVGILLVLCTILILSISFLFKIFDDKKVVSACLYEEKVNSFNLDINSNNYLIAKIDEDVIPLYANLENEKIYPASLTKIMTMMVVLDHSTNINENLLVESRDLQGLIEANASVYGLSENDQITVLEALYGLILESGADCANLLVRYIESMGYDFIELMNQKAHELNMDNSHFSSVTGLHLEDNYTTLNDLLKLVEYALKNDNAANILETMHYDSDINGYHFDSTLSLADEFNLDNFKILGGKTGFTLQAHLTICAIVEKQGASKYIILLADGDENGPNGKAGHLYDVANIIETYFMKW